MSPDFKESFIQRDKVFREREGDAASLWVVTEVAVAVHGQY